MRFDREVGGMLECLHLRPELTLFEPLVRRAAAELAALDDERFARVRAVERGEHGLVVVSELVAGERLADLLESRQDDAALAGLDAAFGFLLQALPAIVRLHAIGLVHGTLAPERVILTATSQVVLLDAIYGDALDRLRLSRKTLWTTLSLLPPPAAGSTRIDSRLDVSQIALCALALALARPIRSDSPIELIPLLEEVTDIAQIRCGERFSDDLRLLFGAMLPGLAQGRIVSAETAAAEVERLAREIGEDTALAALADLARFDSSAPAAAAAPAPPEPLRLVSVREPERVKTPAPRPHEVAAPMVVTPPSPPVIVEPSVAMPEAPVTAAAPPAVVIAATAPVTIAPPPVSIDPPPASIAPTPVPSQPPPPPQVMVEPPPVTIAIAPPTPFQPPPIPVQPAPAIRVQPPPVVAPPAPPVVAAEPAVLRIKSERPTGYVPPRPPAHAELPSRAVPFGNFSEASGTRSRLPWKLAAAAALVMLVGITAGRDYLLGGAAPAPAATEPAPVPTKGTPAAAPTGTLSVTTQPAGARVTLNGSDVGVTPLVLEGVAVGRHLVTVATDTVTLRRSVKVETGKQAALDIPVYSGWIAVFSPITLQVSRDGKSLGSSDGARIMLPPGRHILTFTNREFSFSATQTVEVTAGEERAINLSPKGSVNVNALPWAEVWVDGARVGETPLANLQVPLGTREFVFRHPQHGERKLVATITTSAAALSVDFTKPANWP